MTPDSIRPSRFSATTAVLFVVTILLGTLCLMAASTPFAWARGVIDSYSADGSADPYTPALHWRIRITLLAAGVLLSSLALLQSFVARRLKAISDGLIVRLKRECAEWTREIADTSRRLWASLLLLFVIAAGLRLVTLHQPMRYDETMSVIDYIMQPWFVTISKYDFTNNHILHNLLANFCVRLFGEGEASVRMVAFLSGCLLPVLTCWLAWQLTASLPASRLAGALVAISSVLVEYSTNARGYTFQAMLMLICWLAALNIVERRRFLGFLVLAIAGACGIWAIPTMIYPLAMIWSWMVLVTGRRDGLEAGWKAGLLTAALAIVTVGLSGILYVPVLLYSGPKALFANQYVAPLTFQSWLEQVPLFVQDTAEFLVRDFPLPARCLLGLGILLALFDPRNPRLKLLRWAALSIGACFMVVVLQRVLPARRIWLFLLPLLSVLAASGLASGIERFPTLLMRRMAWTVTCLVCLVWPVIHEWRHQSILASPEGGTIPDARAAADFLSETLRPREAVIVICPVTYPLKYYSSRLKLDMGHFDWPGSEHASEDHAILVTGLHWEPEQTPAMVLEALGLSERFPAEEFQLIKEYPSCRIYRFDRKSSPMAE